MIDVGLTVLTYLDQCEQVGKQETFSELAGVIAAAGGSPEEVFHGMRWLFDGEYAVRTRPNQFALTDKGREALSRFRAQAISAGSE